MECNLSDEEWGDACREDGGGWQGFSHLPVKSMGEILQDSEEGEVVEGPSSFLAAPPPVKDKKDDVSSSSTVQYANYPRRILETIGDLHKWAVEDLVDKEHSFSTKTSVQSSMSLTGKSGELLSCKKELDGVDISMLSCKDMAVHGSKLVRRDGRRDGQLLYLEGCDSVCVEACVLRAPNSAQCVVVKNCNHITFEKCFFMDANICVEGSSNITFKDCYFQQFFWGSHQLFLFNVGEENPRASLQISSSNAISLSNCHFNEVREMEYDTTCFTHMLNMMHVCGAQVYMEGCTFGNDLTNARFVFGGSSEISLGPKNFVARACLWELRDEATLHAEDSIFAHGSRVHSKCKFLSRLSFHGCRLPFMDAQEKFLCTFGCDVDLVLKDITLSIPFFEVAKCDLQNALWTHIGSEKKTGSTCLVRMEGFLGLLFDDLKLTPTENSSYLDWISYVTDNKVDIRLFHLLNNCDGEMAVLNQLYLSIGDKPIELPVRSFGGPLPNMEEFDRWHARMATHMSDLFSFKRVAQDGQLEPLKHSNYEVSPLSMHVPVVG